MGLSQIGTKIILPALAAVLTFNSFALANDRFKTIQDLGDIKSRLSSLYAYKNRPFPANLTVDANAITELKKAAEAAKGANAKPLEKSIKMGGVSDGGGNAVQGTLFDFFENQGSLEITLDELLALEPFAVETLQRLALEVPSIRHAQGPNFGKELKESLKNKTIYLEEKDITSEECMNSSMVGTSEQYIAACQSNKELRVSVKYLLQKGKSPEEAKLNRAGLFVHELVLGWARSNSSEEKKKEVEYSVRDLTRDIFAGKPVAQSIIKNFRTRAYSQERKSAVFALREKMDQTLAQFCVNPTSIDFKEFDEAINDKFLYQEIEPNDQNFLHAAIGAKGNVNALNELQKGSICEDHLIDNTPLRQPNFNFMTKDCTKEVEDAARRTAAYISSPPAGLNPDENKSIIRSYLTLPKIISLSCSISTGVQLQKQLFMSQERYEKIKKDAANEAMMYFRYLMRQQGHDVKFVESRNR